MNAEERALLVQADSLLSLVAYRGAGAVDDEWKSDAKELISKLRHLYEESNE